MRREATLLGLILCVTCLTGAATAQNNNSTPSLETPARSNARDNHPDAPTRVNAEAINEVETLRRRVEEVEEQHHALGLLLKELKNRLDSAQPSEVASNSPISNSATHAGTTPEAATPPSNQNDSGNPRWADLIGEGNKFKLYGFVRLDAIFDSQQPNNAQSILFIKSPDPRIGNEMGDLAMHPRLTRFGIDYSGPRIARLGDAKLTGKLETDFQNGGTESRQIIRVRHAYLRLDWKNANLLAGQTWDTVSPLFPTVNADTLQWNAGNIGDRRPQLRITYEPKAGDGKFSFTGGKSLKGAIDALDLDTNGVRDGEESARPNIQARVGFSHPLGSKDRSASVGVSGFYGFFQTGRPRPGRN